MKSERQDSNQAGLFVVIEGSDGSGKGTQFKLLSERLKAEGYAVSCYDFPQYENESSYFVREYLNGKYGTAEALGPYTPSLFYALDRFSVSQQIKADLAAGKVVLSNRYVGSNMAHQGTKFSGLAERQAFFKWLDQLEFEMLAIPRPDANIVLLVPAETAQQLVDQKAERGYTSQKRDLHEADLTHLSRAVEVYQQLCQTFPDNFTAIDCTNESELMTIPTINNLIFERIKPMLGRLRKLQTDTNDQAPKAATTTAEVFAPKKTVDARQISQSPNTTDTPNQLVQKNDNGSYSVTAAGRDYLAQRVTNTEGSVYAFTDKISADTVAAAMARLSRRGDDMRVTILDEFSEQAGKDEGLLRRVITAYGDDSVQQLTGIHFVVENASQLLTKKLEWGRLAAYLEQSTRYIFFDQKDEHGKYKYYTPTTLDAEATQHYNQKMDELFTKYSDLVATVTEHVRSTSKEQEANRDGAWKAATRAQACDAIRPVLPVATTATVGVFASGQALESLIMHLQSDESAEAVATGNALLTEARKIVPVFLERADKPDRGGAWIAYRANTRAAMATIAEKQNLQPIKGSADNPVQLTEFWPRNEFELLPAMLYEHSSLSLEELQAQVNRWSYDDKLQAYQAYMGERLNRRHKPGRALEVAHYNFDLVCDYGIFRDLQRHRMVDSLEWQALSPHYGFDMPGLVSEAGIEDLFEECFELSFQLYQYLADKGYRLEAQYATLLGHKMRWKIMLNAREAFHFMELRTSPQGHPGYRKLAKQMYDKIAEVHPVLAASMLFVNQGEDPELTRLAAERATQFKLQNIDKKQS